MIPKAAQLFALLFVRKTKQILLCQNAAGRWFLPGGEAKPDENEVDAIKRLVAEQAGYKVHVKRQIGPQYLIGGHVTKAYDCETLEQSDKWSKEIADVRFVTLQEYAALPLEMQEQLRILLDGFSILQQPLRVEDPEVEYLDLLPIDQVFTTHDQTCLVEVDDERQCTWGRLDPSTPSGYMEAP